MLCALCLIHSETQGMQTPHCLPMVDIEHYNINALSFDSMTKANADSFALPEDIDNTLQFKLT